MRRPGAADRLPSRLRSHLEGAPLRAGDTVVVALSGGLDSVALLHLLRFPLADLGLRLRAAHVDHAMRPGSAADADWVRGLCQAWGVPLHTDRLDPPARSEADARHRRYAVLSVALDAALDGAAPGKRGWVLTAHHADDQAETVLFRARRGAGLRGLRGIARRRGRLLRPLLPWRRRELEAYAREAGLGWREDPTNRDTGYARNRIRHVVLPALEAARPGTTEVLARLAARAAAASRRVARVVGRMEAAVVEAEVGGELVLARGRLGVYDRALQGHLLRHLLRRYGSAPDRAGTHAALEFISSGPSGGELHLPGGVRLERDFDRVRITRRPREGGDDDPSGDRGLRLEGGTGTGRARIGGRWVEVAWGGAPGRGGWPHRAVLPADTPGPLELRGWRPGDRIRFAYGRKKLKSLFRERRLDRRERQRVPVVVDGTGAVVWIVGVARAEGVGEDGVGFEIAVRMPYSNETMARTGGAELKRIVYSAEEIAHRVTVMGEEISEAYPKDEEILVLGLLKGSFIFMADLVRHIARPVTLDFLVASSYGSGTVSSGQVQLLYDPENTLKDKHVILVEDIVDSGTTMNRLIPMLEERGPKSLEICALLHKHVAKELVLEPRWVGFDAPHEFLIGYGLDHSENFRNLPFIGSLKPPE